MSGWICGSIMCAEKRTSAQPFPNAKVSRCGFARPQAVNFRIAQSLACMTAGPPVSLGP